MPYSMPQSWYDDYDPAGVMYPDENANLTRAAAYAQDQDYPVAAGAPDMPGPPPGPSGMRSIGQRFNPINMARRIGQNVRQLPSRIGANMGMQSPSVRTPPFQPSGASPQQTMESPASDQEDHTLLDQEMGSSAPVAPTAPPGFTTPASTSPNTAIPTPPTLRGAMNRVPPATPTIPANTNIDQSMGNQMDPNLAAQQRVDALLTQGPPQHSDPKYKRKGAAKIFGALGDAFTPNLTNRRFREDVADYNSSVAAATAREKAGQTRQDEQVNRGLKTAQAKYYEAGANERDEKPEILAEKNRVALAKVFDENIMKSSPRAIPVDANGIPIDPQFKDWTLTITEPRKGLKYGIPPGDLLVTEEMAKKASSLAPFVGKSLPTGEVLQLMKNLASAATNQSRENVANTQGNSRVKVADIHAQMMKDVQAERSRNIKLIESGKNARTALNAAQINAIYKGAQAVNNREHILLQDLNSKQAQLTKMNNDPLDNKSQVPELERQIKELEQAINGLRSDRVELDNIMDYQAKTYGGQPPANPTPGPRPVAPRVAIPGQVQSPAGPTSPSGAANYLQKFK